MKPFWNALVKNERLCEWGYFRVEIWYACWLEQINNYLYGTNVSQIMELKNKM